MTPPDLEDDEELATEPGEVLEVELTEPAPRLDKALASAVPTLSRARLQALMADGAVSLGDRVLSDASAKAERAPVDPNANAIVKVASWLRANL